MASGPAPGASIEFQDLPHTGGGQEHSHPDVSLDVHDTQGLLRSQPQSDPNAPTPSICSLAYFMRFFDVTSTQVLGRLGRSMLPFGRPFFSGQDSKPDLYGPWWICTTLVFVMAATGNFASYLEFEPTADKPTWKSDLQKLTLAASVFYFTVFCMPIILYLWLSRANEPRGLIELIALYGYSLFVFVPTCLICVVPIEGLRWAAVAGSLGLSLGFLLRNLRAAAHSESLEPAKTPLALLAFVAVYHAGVALLVKMYFFDFD